MCASSPGSTVYRFNGNSLSYNKAENNGFNMGIAAKIESPVLYNLMGTYVSAKIKLKFNGKDHLHVSMKIKLPPQFSR